MWIAHRIDEQFGLGAWNFTVFISKVHDPMWLRIFQSSKTQALCNRNVSACETPTGRLCFGDRGGTCYAVYGTVMFKLGDNTGHLWQHCSQVTVY